MASKWAGLKDRKDDDGNPKYPPAPLGKMGNAGDKKFIEKVDIAKFEYQDLTLAQLMTELNAQDEVKDDLEEQVKDANVKLEALGKLIIVKFEENQVNSVKADFGKTIYLSIEPYVSVRDKEQFEKHVTANADLDYLWSVHSQTLGSLVKDYLEKGQDDQIPPGLEVFLKTAVRLKKS